MKPKRKVSAAGIGGAIGILITWLLGTLGVDVTAEAGAAISTIAAFGLGYLVPAEDLED